MQYETMFGHKDQQSQLGKGDESATFAGQCQHRGTFGDVVQVGLKQTVLNGQAGCIISDKMAYTRYGARLRTGRSVAVRFQNLIFSSASNAQRDMEAHFKCQVQPFRFPPNSARPEKPGGVRWGTMILTCRLACDPWCSVLAVSRPPSGNHDSLPVPLGGRAFGWPRSISYAVPRRHRRTDWCW